MDKRAQNRSYRSRVWEKVNPLGRGWEALDSEGSALMDKMRAIDEKIREVADDVKPLVREAKSALRRRNYLAAGHSLVGFHGRCKLVAHLLQSFEKHVELNHGSFLLNNFEEPYQNELLDSDPDFKIDDDFDIANANIQFDALVKEAGALSWMKDKFLGTKDRIGDAGSNLLTGEGLGKLLRDKRFNVGFMKQTKTMTTDLVSKSDKMLRDLLSIFSELEKGISRRNPRYYSLQARQFIKKFEAYHLVYKKYHATIVVPLKAQRDAAKAAAEKKKQHDEQVASQKAYDAYSNNVTQQGDQIERMVQQQNEHQKHNPHSQRANPAYVEQSFDTWKKRNAPPAKITNEEADSKLPEDKEYDAWKAKYTQPANSTKTNVSDIDQVQKNKDDAEYAKMTKRLNLNDESEDVVPGVAAHEEFIDRITIYADADDVPAFVNTLLDYSEELEETDPTASGNLLSVASKLINDYKTAGVFDFLKGKPGASNPADKPEVKPALPSALRHLQPKPEELTEERQNLLRQKKVNLPDGKIERGYTELGFLKHITPDAMRVTSQTADFIINTFAKRLAKAQKIDDLEPYMESIEQNLIPRLKEALYNGWVIKSYPVEDTANPNDKYIDIYTRLKLSTIDPALAGVAKLYVSCRASAENGTLTLRGIVKKHFEIDTPKSTPTPQKPSQPTPELEDDEPPPNTRRSSEIAQEFDDNGEEIDHGGFDDRDDQYDTE